jgi:tRNA threonylcarbamoyladenosine biosynthesis protein TsaE
MTAAVFHISSMDETDLLGELLARVLVPKDVVGLIGDLGAGKTYLAGAVARGLGVPPSVPVTSPTFTLIKEYRGGRLPIYHMDLYRISDPQDLYELGMWEYYDGDGVCLVEWSNLFSDLWPDHALVISIALGEGECRTITASGRLRGEVLVRALEQAWNNRLGN